MNPVIKDHDALARFGRAKSLSCLGLRPKTSRGPARRSQGNGPPFLKRTEGTRLSVDFLLRLFGNGWTVQEVLESYPRLTPDALQAVFAYAAECMSEEALYSLQTGS